MEEHRHRQRKKTTGILLVLALIWISLFILVVDPYFTGNIINQPSQEQELILDISVQEPTNISLDLTNITSFRLSGNLSGEGKVTVWLLVNDTLYKVMDHDSVETFDNLITGMTALEPEQENSTNTTDINVSPTENTTTNVTISPENTTSNNTANATQENITTVNLTESITNQTNSTRNETANETVSTNNTNSTVPEINVSENLSLQNATNISYTNATVNESETNITANPPLQNETNQTETDDVGPPVITNTTENETTPETTHTFVRQCIDTCHLTPEDSPAVMMIEVENATLYLQAAYYTQPASNAPPQQIILFENITLSANTSKVLHLDEFFIDPDSVPLFDVSTTPGLDVTIQDSVANIIGQIPGTYPVHFYAVDEENIITGNAFTVTILAANATFPNETSNSTDENATGLLRIKDTLPEKPSKVGKGWEEHKNPDNTITRTIGGGRGGMLDTDGTYKLLPEIVKVKAFKDALRFSWHGKYIEFEPIILFENQSYTFSDLQKENPEATLEFFVEQSDRYKWGFTVANLSEPFANLTGSIEIRLNPSNNIEKTAIKHGTDTISLPDDIQLDISDITAAGFDAILDESNTITISSIQFNSPVIIDPTLQVNNSANMADISGDDYANYAYQIRWDISDIPADQMIVDATFCPYAESSSGGTLDTDATIWRVADQTWTESTSASTINSQSLTNQTTTKTWSSLSYPVWACINVSEQVAEDYAQSNSYASFRIQDPDYPVSSISETWDVVPFTTCMAAVFSSNWICFNDRENGHSDGKTPMLNITYQEIPSNLPPSGMLVSPTNGTSWFWNTFNFTCNGTDDTGLANISIYGNISGTDGLNQTNNVTGTENETTFEVFGIPDGLRNWTCLITDNESETRWANTTFLIRVGLPNITGMTPGTGGRITDNGFNLTCNTSDLAGLKNVSIFHNIEGSWKLNETKDITGMTNSSIFSYTATNNGTYKWNCLVYDNSGQSYWNPSNHTITIGSAAVNLSQPVDNIIADENVTFVCNVTTGIPLDNLSLYVSATSSWEPNATRELDGVTMQINYSDDTADVALFSEPDGDTFQNLSFQIKWDISAIPENATVLDAELCLFINRTQDSGLLDNDAISWRIDDQTWTEASSVSTINAQSKTNQTSTSVWNSTTEGTLSCLNITAAIAEDNAKDNTYSTVRVADLDWYGGTIQNVYDTAFGLTNGWYQTDYYKFNDRENVFLDNNRPRLVVTYAEADPYTFSLSSLPGGTYTWNCEVMDYDGMAYTADANRTFKIGSINTCNPKNSTVWLINSTLNCSDVNTNVSEINISNNAVLTIDGGVVITGNTAVDPGATLHIQNAPGTIWQNDNLTIGGTFILDNSTLRMNGTGDGSVGINVTGTFIANNSANITNGEDVSAHYFFIVNDGAVLNITDSKISYAGWGDSLGQKGLEINTTNAIVRDTEITNNYIGITVYGDNAVLEGNDIHNNTYQGIYLRNGASNTTISGNNISTNNSGAIALNAEYGIIHTLIIGNNITTYQDFSEAIYAYSSIHNLTIVNNTINTYGSDSSNGIRLQTSAENNTLENNTIHLDAANSDAISLEDQASHNSLRFNNILTSTAGAGIHLLNNAQNNTIEENNITATDADGEGIYIGTSSSENSIVNSIINATGSALHLYSNSGNSLDNLFENLTLTNLTGTNVEQQGNVHDTVLRNLSFNSSAIAMSSSGSYFPNLTIQWFVKVNVTDLNGSGLNNAEVNVTDINDNSVFSEITDASGLTGWYSLKERIMNTTHNITFNNHTVNVSAPLYMDTWESVNFTESTIYNLIPDGPINITEVNITPSDAGLNETIHINISTAWLDQAWMQLQEPDGSLENHSMTHTAANTWEINLSSWKTGQHNLTFFLNNSHNVIDHRENYSFNVTVNLTLQAFPLKDIYYDDEDVNLTDPPGADDQTGPVILEANVSPTKVMPGDTMHIMARVQDPAGIKNVTATMPYDGGQDLIPLLLTSGTFQNGTWTNTWQVHDTTTKTYTTTIQATNKQNQTTAATVEWDDPTTLELDYTYLAADIYADLNTNAYMAIQTKWDISSIPSDKIINNASMCAYIYFISGSPDNDVTVYKITDQSWDESISASSLTSQQKTNQTSATWSSLSQNAYSCTNVTAQVREEYNKQNQYMTLRLVDSDYIVSSFDNVYDLQGLTVGSGGAVTASISFKSSEAANPPKLYIDYTSPPIIYSEFSENPSTTDLSEFVSDENVSFDPLVLADNSNNVKISFLDVVDLNATMSLDDAVDMGENAAYVNITLYPALDVPANITFYNISYREPIILKDGVTCSDCEIISYNSITKTLKFNVTGFSNYTAAEGNQSKITNNGTTNNSVYLIMEVQAYSGGSWVTDDVVVNTSLQVNGTDLVKLDQLFNGNWNTSSKDYGYGTYRIYAALLDNESNVLINSTGDYLNTTFNFSILSSSPEPSITTQELAPSTPHTNDTLQCTVNVYDYDTSSLELNITWLRDGASILNVSLPAYTQSTTYVSNLTHNYTYHNNNITCNITAADGTYITTGEVSVIIQNYSTSIDAENQTGTMAGEPTLFTANYSSDDWGPVGAIIFRSEDMARESTLVALKAFDNNSDGWYDSIVYGDGDTSHIGNFTAISANGTYLWNNPSSAGSKNSFRIADVDNDDELEIVGSNLTGVTIMSLDGTIEYQFMEPDKRIGSVTLADIDQDGDLEIIIGTYDSYVGAYNHTGEQLWNATGGGATSELLTYDIDGDGYPDYLGASIAYRRYLLNITNGSQIWNASSYGYSPILFEDVMGDATKELIELRYNYGGGGDKAYGHDLYTGAWTWQNNYPYVSNAGRDMVATDLNADGRDDILFVYGINELRASNNDQSNDSTFWNYTLPNTGSIPAMWLADLNDDGRDEVALGSESSEVMILSMNTSNATLLVHTSFDEGSIGDEFQGISEALDAQDMNHDGVTDVIAGTRDGYIYILQEAECTLRFNDSVVGMMDYNYTTKQWEYWRNFSNASSTQIYDYNVTCTKGGYDSQFYASETEIAPNMPPEYANLTILPEVPHTNDTLHCVFNVTDDSAAATNITVRWYRDGENILNDSVTDLSNATEAWVNLTHNHIYHDNNITCTVTAADGQFANISDANVTINNYTTSIEVTNETGKTVQQDVAFTANYTSPGFGLVGRILWSNTTMNFGEGPYVVRAYACENVSEKTCIFTGGWNWDGGDASTMAFYRNGTQAWEDKLWDSGAWAATVLESGENKTNNLIFGGRQGSQVYNETGILYNNRTDKPADVVAADLDGQGIQNDFIYLSENFNVQAYNTTDASNWSLLWNIELNGTGSNEVGGELELVDTDNDGQNDTLWVQIGSETMSRTFKLNLSGYLLWNSSIMPYYGYGVAPMDINGDGIASDVFFTEYQRAYAYYANGSQAWNTTAGSQILYPFEATAFDYQNNNIKDDVLVSTVKIIALYPNGSVIWTTPIETTSWYEIRALGQTDLDDDGISEIFTGTAGSKLAILNKSGSIQWSYRFNTDTIGIEKPYFGTSEGIDVMDQNQDAINDLIVATEGKGLYVVQDVNCQIIFNDSTTANMTWNDTTKLWEYNRSFATQGDYAYNVTCTKGGYEPQIYNSISTIGPNDPPEYANLTILPEMPHTNDTLSCVFNTTDDHLSSLNITVRWYRDGENILNASYQNIPNATEVWTNLTHNYTYHDKNITCTVSTNDGLFTNTSDANTTINNYTTTIIVVNATNTAEGQNVNFTANYSSPDFGDIGRILWSNTSLNFGTGPSVVRAYACENVSEKTCIFAGGWNWDAQTTSTMAFYRNGTQAWEDKLWDSGAWTAAVLESGENKTNNLIFGGRQGSQVYNETGLVFTNRTDHPADVIALDLDGQGIKNDFIYLSLEFRISAYNTTDEKNWSKLWSVDLNGTGGDQGGELEYVDTDNDGVNDTLWVIIGSWEVSRAFKFNTSGYLLWNSSNLSAWGYGIAPMDINGDGIASDVFFTENNRVFAYYANGSQAWNTTAGGEIAYPFEAIPFDYQNDGHEDDILVTTTKIIALYPNGSVIWKKMAETTGGYEIRALGQTDLDDDGVPDIYAGSDMGGLSKFNKTGSMQWFSRLGTGSIGIDVPYFGRSNGIDPFDQNQDAINDLIVGTKANDIYIVQDVNCIITFNDTAVPGNMTWNDTTKLWEYNRSFATQGDYAYNVTCTKGGYEPQLYQSVSTITANTPPVITTPAITPDPAYASDALECAATATDAEQTSLTIEVKWYNNSVLFYAQNISATNASQATANLTAGLQHRGEDWNCTMRAYDYMDFSTNKSDNLTISNTPPGDINLSYPKDGDATFTNRSTHFNWTNASDPDQDPINYTIEVSLFPDMSDPLYNVTGIFDDNITLPGELDFAQYFWRVRPFDGYDYGNYSPIFNFTLVPYVDILLVNDSIDFGLMQPGDQQDTTDDTPFPFIVRNIGNMEANLTLNASALFDQDPYLNVSSYEYLINASDIDTFDPVLTLVNWTNMTNTSILSVVRFNHSTANNELRIDLRIQVPTGEPIGEKQSIVTIEGGEY